MAAYWRNGGKRDASHISRAKKLQLINLASRPCIANVWAKWPYTKQRYTYMTSLQRELVRYSARIQPTDDEDVVAYSRRREREVTNIIGDARWGDMYAEAVTKWSAHVDRNHGNFWHGNLCKILPPEELGMRRAVSENDRPATRIGQGSGGIPRRWQECLAAAKIQYDAVAEKLHLARMMRRRV